VIIDERGKEGIVIYDTLIPSILLSSNTCNKVNLSEAEK
jgi:hypothetical protein